MRIPMKSLLSVAVLCCGLAMFAVAADDDKPKQVTAAPSNFSDWTILRVPGTWDENSQGRLDKYDGFGWYRCGVTIPGSWRGKDFQLLVSQVDNAHEAFFNGTKLGGAGSFPPKYKSGLAQDKIYTVPAKLLQPGKENVVVIRVYDNDGKGGFKSNAPVLKLGEKAIALNGHWEFRTGDDLSWAKGPTRLTNVGIFWRVMDASMALANATGSSPPLSPAAAAKTFTIPDDLALDQVLAEPEIRQPLFVNFDERGRMWVMQYLQYPYPAGLKMVSRDKFWRSVYDKIPSAPPNHFRGADKITIHEDTDGDGVFDKHKTFLDGLSIASSFERGRGGVWVLNPPYLLFYPDRNNDDIPDGDPEVHLSGFGMEDTHSVANSLRWGPDGWLYACQGSTVSGNILRPGLDKKPTHSMGQLIWRYHPETRRYEIFAEGGGNSFGCEIDEKGRIYSGHNGGNTRGFHYVQGGYFRKGFTKHGPLTNPFSFGYFESMQHAAVPRFTHNFVIYDGGSLPKTYHGKLFGVEPMQGRVVQSEISPDRSSFKTVDLNRPINTEDVRFRPVDIKVGPDGAIYVCDLYEPQISHREHFAGQIDKSNGRIYRLRGKNAKPIAPFDLSKKSSKELVATLGHSNKWFRQTAQRLLADRKDKSIIPLLKQTLAEKTGQVALEALWALKVTGGFDQSLALQTITHDDPFVRLWTVRMLCDEKRVSTAVAAKLADQARSETDLQARSQMAASAKRLPAKQALSIIANLLSHEADAGDVHIPLLLWWAIESKCKTDSEAVVDLFTEPALWNAKIVGDHILERLMRRFAQSGSRHDLLMCAQLLGASPNKASTAKLMRGFELAFKGRSLARLPIELSQALAKAGGGSLTLRVRQGDKQAVAEGLAVVKNAKADALRRIEFVQTFGEVDEPQAVPVLVSLLVGANSDDLKNAALTSLQSHSEESIGSEVIKQYATFSEDVRPVAQTLLASRKAWSRQLLEAIDAEKVNKSTLPLEVVRKLTIHRDDRIAALVKKYWKNVAGATNAEMQARIQHFAGIITSSDSGSPSQGKLLYVKSCGKCHLLFGEGGRIGPDLTTFKRKDSVNILINVVNPSAEVREGFETYLIVTDEGRVINGFLFDQDNRVVVLRGADGQNITVQRDNIDEMIKQRKSLMPEGLLKDLSEEDVRNLFAYLRSSQPLN
jgi:putative heme-binding domain-containing protein